ncbi:MAG: tannase/feruloyl esterase family alpha/beta hydrolase, partial [Candidatus Sulfotelmatobacter sp.]
AQEKTGNQMNATNPDISAFLARGGKLILYHGWNDPGISPLNTVNYYEEVVKTVGGQKAEQSVRLYMVPGMQHCGGGPGATSFGQGESAPRSAADHDVFTSLVQWVEDGKAPGTIIASKYGDKEGNVLDMTRPLCAYPQEVKYNGTGDPKLAASFSCAEGK